jgi:uncharacterized protein (TIGR02246 family)
MKIVILTAFATAVFNFCGKAQYTGITAERFRSMVNADHPEWNSKINYSTINKSNMKKTILMATVITAAMSLNAQTNVKEEDAIRAVVRTVETGWAEKSGEKYASGFAEVHDFIVWNGYYFPNQTRQGTAAGHQNLFNGMYKNMDVKLKVDKIKFIRNDIALVHTYGVLYEKGKPVPENPGVLMTMLMEKKQDEWQIISFHNLDLEAFQDKEVGDRSPIPLNIMYAGWYKK